MSLGVDAEQKTGQRRTLTKELNSKLFGRILKLESLTYNSRATSQVNVFSQQAAHKKAYKKYCFLPPYIFDNKLNINIEDKSLNICDASSRGHYFRESHKL